MLLDNPDYPLSHSDAPGSFKNVDWTNTFNDRKFTGRMNYVVSLQ